jgi:hypothetical protein
MYVRLATEKKGRSFGGMAKPTTEQMAKQDTIVDAALHWSNDILYGIAEPLCCINTPH